MMMKKKCIFFLSCLLLTCSCSQTGKTGQSTEPSDDLTDRQKDSTEVIGFIERTYDDVFSAYNKKGSKPDVEAFDKSYLSPDFLLWQKELEKVSAKYPGEIVGPDGGDHWIQAQDWDQVSMQIDSISLSDNLATAVITITHSGNCVGTERLRLLLCKDDAGNWCIDDFANLSAPNAVTEKAAIKMCVAEEQLSELYAEIISECKRQRRTRDYTNLDDFNSVPYVTEEYHRLYQQVDSMDEANHTEGLRFFNYDHWGLGQEFLSIDSATVSACTLTDDGRADVTLNLVVRADYIQESETAHEPRRLLLKWEEGEWRVDDFIRGLEPLEKALSEKEMMKNYLVGKE